MHRHRCIKVCCLSALLGAGLASLAGADPPSPAALRQRLTPVFQALATDPQYIAFESELRARPGDPQVIDRILRWLPLSPKEMMEIDMHLRHFEHMIPRQVIEYHQRWVRLHPETARQYYGDAVVEQIIRHLTPDVSADAPPATTTLASAATVGTNRNAAATFLANPPDDYQGELQLVVNPNNAQQVVAGSNTADSGVQSVFYSADGGTTWGHTFPPGTAGYGTSCPNGFFEFGSDPALAWDNAGNVYIEHMLLCADGVFTTLYSIRIARSADGGATWAGHGTIADSFISGRIEERALLDIDRNPGSPFSGRFYTCWDRNSNQKTAWSSDAGATWNEVDLPTAAAGAFELACELAIAKDGSVHIIWDTLTCPDQSGCTDERMFYSRSVNGGVSWSAPMLLQDFNLTGRGAPGVSAPPAQNSRGISPFGAIGVDNSGGPCDGDLYVTFSDFAPAGEDVLDTDIWLIRSADGGATWSPRLKVNDDGLADRTQFHPFLVVDQGSGNVYIGWHDTRNDPAAERVDYFLARSTDCGASIEANVRASVSSAEFNNDSISWSNQSTVTNPSFNPNQFGEYIGLDVMGDQVYFGWSDTRHFFPAVAGGEPQQENIGFARVSFGPAVIFADGFEAGNTAAWSSTVP